MHTTKMAKAERSTNLSPLQSYVSIGERWPTKLYRILVLFAAVATSAGSLYLVLVLHQSPRVPELTAKPAIVDLGRIPPGRKVRARFTLVNQSRLPIEITAVRPSCTCGFPSLSTRKILPNSLGNCFFDWDTPRHRGKAHTGAMVYYRVGETGVQNQLWLRVMGVVDSEAAFVDRRISSYAP